MDELPRDARELLALARDSHDPPDDAVRDRVRKGVALAVAAGAGGAIAGKAVAAATTTGATKTGLFAATSTKLLLAGSVIMVAGATAIGVPQLAQREPRDKPTVVANAHGEAPREPTSRAAPVAPATPDAPVAPVAVEPANAPAEAVATSDRSADTTLHEAHAVKRRAHVTQGKPVTAPEDALRAEMALLREASKALDADQATQALARLDEHAQRFAHGQLVEEREGLRVLAHCLRRDAGAEARARAFVRKSPGSVLASRVEHACKLGGKP